MEQDKTEGPAIGHGEASPIRTADRYQALDVLRGVAVLGILVMNIYAFAMPWVAYNNPLAMGGTDALNLGTWFVTHIFFDQKFMTIFSMMYGAGIVMMLQRANAKNARFGRLFYRRSFWLLLVGMFHAYFIWFGDILFGYALTGMIIFLFRNKSVRTLLIVGSLFLAIGSLSMYSGGFFMGKMKVQSAAAQELVEQGEELTEDQQYYIEQWDLNRPFVSPNDTDIQKDIDAYKGSYRDILEHRIPLAVNGQVSSVLFFILWRSGGLMLIGMALMKLGILSGQKDLGYYRKMMVYGYAVGLPIMLYSSYDLHAHQFDGLYWFGPGMMPNYIGSIAMAIGHIGLINYLYQSGALADLFDRFAYAGRMAFTNYLLHSVILTTVFYGYGLDLYTEVPRFAQMGFVVAVIAFQLFASKWWLQRYRFGPAEWLWRSLTYWHRQPMAR